MAVNTTTITGDVFLPSGAVREKSYVIFEMTGFDTDAPDGATVVPYPIRAAISAGGSISQALWPNPDGVRTTFYNVTFEIYDGTAPVLVAAGKISVPTSGGPYKLNALLPITPPAGATVADYIAQLAAATTTATTAASAASAAASSASASALTATTKAAEASASAATVAASTAKLNQFSPTRNFIINSTGRVNQRGYVSYAATTAANQYTVDRWRVVVSGQTLGVTSNAFGGYNLAPPAGGVEQVIEGTNFPGGSYVISWEGNSTCTVDGISRASGATFTLAANTAHTVRMSGGGFYNLQLERGTVPTTYTPRSISDDEAMCYRYYETGSLMLQSPVTGAVVANMSYKTKKRTSPAITLTDVTAVNVSSRSVVGAGDTTTCMNVNAVASAAGGYIVVNWTSSAEL